jgi:hypothetical protein
LLDWKRLRFRPREAAGNPRKHRRRVFASPRSVPAARRIAPQAIAKDMRGSRPPAARRRAASTSAPFSLKPQGAKPLPGPRRGCITRGLSGRVYWLMRPN